jgi:hypothetical protein
MTARAALSVRAVTVRQNAIGNRDWRSFCLLVDGRGKGLFAAATD